MKKIYSSILVLLLMVSPALFWANPQDSITLTGKDYVDMDCLYLGLGLGGGIGGGLSGSSLKFVLSSGWGISLNSQINFREDHDLPVDFVCGFPGEACRPTDHLKIRSINLHRQFKTSNKKLRWAFEAGPTIITERSPMFKKNFNYTPGGFVNSANYVTNYYTNTGYGLNAKASVEFPLITFFGLGLAATSQMNKLRSSIGYEIYLNFGLVRKKQQPPEI